MSERDVPEVRTLDPVVVEALASIAHWMQRRRGPRLRDTFRRSRSLLDRDARSYAISAFKHLRHGGYDFAPFLVRRWALANGWKEPDAQLLDDYAAGVLAGVRYHHSDPVGHDAIARWQRVAHGAPAWADPGRAQPGTAFAPRN